MIKGGNRHLAKRLVLACEVPLATVSGLTNVIRRLLCEAGERGYVASVIAPAGKRSTPTDIQARSESITLLPSYPLPQYPSLRLAPVRTTTMQHMISALEPDVVHAVDPYLLGRAALTACQRAQVPAVASYHTHIPAYLGYYRLSLLDRLLWRWIRFNYRCAAEVLVPTQAIGQQLEKYGIGPVATWSRGVDTELFCPSRRNSALRAELLAGRKHLAVCVGRLAPEKNIPFLIDALRPLNDVRLVFVGGGPSRARLETRYADHGVRFVGTKARSDVACYFACADLFVFSSRTETFGQVLNEALASGLPVVAVETAVTREVLTHKAPGHLVAEDPTSFRGAVESILQNHTWPSRQARSLAMKRSWTAAMDALFASYDRVIGHRPR